MDKLRSFSTLNGPFSINNAKTDEHPGPPVSQITNGSLDGESLDSNNQ